MFNGDDDVRCSTTVTKMLCEDIITTEDYNALMDKLNTYCEKNNIPKDRETFKG